MIEEENPDGPYPACIGCGYALPAVTHFCPQCGIRQLLPESDAATDKWSVLKQSAVFYGLLLGLCLLSLKLFTNLWTHLVFLNLPMSAITIFFFVLYCPGYKKLMKWPYFSWRKLAAYCALAFSGSFLVYYSVEWINRTLFHFHEHHTMLYRQLKDMPVVKILLTAAFPAIVEEIGFRGYLLQNMLIVSNERQAVYITSFLFAILHLSFLSLFWLVPFAVLIGFVRIREKTIWYGVVVHFCFNLTSCLISIIH